MGGVHRDDMESLAKIFVQDMVLCAGDRHSENIIKDESGKWYAIDNEMWGGERNVQAWMKSMDGVVDTGDIVTHCPQVSWMVKQYRGKDMKSDFKSFKEHVINNLKTVVEHTDELIPIYDKLIKSDNSFIFARAKNVSSSLNDIKDYIKEL